jgi:hypothetical protein
MKSEKETPVLSGGGLNTDSGEYTQAYPNYTISIEEPVRVECSGSQDSAATVDELTPALDETEICRASDGSGNVTVLICERDSERPHCRAAVSNTVNIVIVGNGPILPQLHGCAPSSDYGGEENQVPALCVTLGHSLRSAQCAACVTRHEETRSRNLVRTISVELSRLQ